MLRYRDEINDIIMVALGSDYCIKTEQIWTCLQYPDATNVYRLNFSSGEMYVVNRATTDCSIRVICLD